MSRLSEYVLLYVYELYRNTPSANKRLINRTEYDNISVYSFLNFAVTFKLLETKWKIGGTVIA